MLDPGVVSPPEMGQLSGHEFVCPGSCRWVRGLGDGFSFQSILTREGVDAVGTHTPHSEAKQRQWSLRKQNQERPKVLTFWKSWGTQEPAGSWGRAELKAVARKPHGREVPRQPLGLSNGRGPLLLLPAGLREAGSSIGTRQEAEGQVREAGTDRNGSN